ncbi:MAG: L,D-transpeptidase family protein [Bacteroidetes bacterium]|nr:L,D-transpeptidase family protein [Bacteroidota bacterium]
MKWLTCFFLLLNSIGCSSVLRYAGSNDTIRQARQLVVVLSAHDSDTQAQLRRFEKKGKKWQPVGRQVPVTLGRTGLAWGSGLHKAQPGRQKREGDGKSPAGVFSFGKIFGYATPSEVHFKMPYVLADEALECVDDSGSKFYNQLVDNRLTQKDWTGSEFMHRADEQYRWGIVVNHNTPAQAQGGSCIFLHIWKEPGAPTSGCTAMSGEDLLTLLHWLDPAERPLLVQVLGREYDIFRKKYGLPELP